MADLETTAETSQTRVAPCVLIADDRCQIPEALEMFLSGQGYRATSVYSGEEALKVAQVLAPDFLISDICLGGMSGVETAILIQDRYPNCKVILLARESAALKILRNAMLDGPSST